MSRTIGGVSLWDDCIWASGDPDGPYGATWSAPSATTDLASRVEDDPDPGDGTPVGPVALGGLRFVVQFLNPTASANAGTSVWGVDGVDNEAAAEWNESVWSNSVGDWVDVSDRVRGLHWQNGVTNPSSAAEVGGATVTCNNLDGALSPWATSGAFVGYTGKTWVRAGMLARWGVLCTDLGTDPTGRLEAFNAFFTGKVDTVQESTSENVDSWVDLAITETTVDLGLTAADQKLMSGQMLTETMFDALLAADWQYQTDMVVPSEDAFVTSTTVSGKSTTERLKLYADAKHWDTMADGRGRVMVTRRRFSDVATGLTFSNAPSGAELPVVQVSPYSSIERIINEITARRVRGPLITRDDVGSTRQFGIVTNRFGFPREDLVLRDNSAVLALIHRVLSLRAWDDVGVDTIELDMDQDAARLPAVMSYIASGARGGASFAARWVHPSGNVFRETFVIEGQTHDVAMMGAQLKWTAVVACGHAGAVSGS